MKSRLVVSLYRRFVCDKVSAVNHKNKIMSLRRIKHTFLRLTGEEKVIGLGALLVLIGSFMPWYSVVLNFDKKSITYNGFGGDLGVVGFVVFLMVLLSIIVLIGEHLHIKLPQLGYEKEQILFFLMGESAFLVLLSIAVYTKRSLDFTNAELRFGIYFALAGAFLGAFAAFAQIQKLKKKEVHEFFEHDEKITEKPSKKHTEEEIEEEQPLFEEEEPLVPEDKIEEPEKITEDEMIEEIEEIQKEEAEETNKAEIIEEGDQGSYFTREAGINKGADEEMDDFQQEKPENAESTDLLTPEDEGDEYDEPEEEKKKKEDEDESSGLSMGFYEDQ